MNSTLLIVLAIAAAAVIIFLLWRSSKRVVIDASNVAPVAPVGRAAPIVLPNVTAPGVSSSSGNVPNNPPPPPPPGIVAKARTMLTPTGQLQHIPVVGEPISNVARKVNLFPVNATLKTNAIVTSSLEHIPVVGKVLAAPSKVAGKVGSAVSSALGSLF